MTDSLHAAPINSYSPTCAERRDSPPRAVCGSSETDRPPSARQRGSLLTERRLLNQFTQVRRSTDRRKSRDFRVQEDTAKREEQRQPGEALKQ